MSQVQSSGTARPKKPRKAAPSHPKYIDMIKEAIAVLKERSGSSRQAICKNILAKYPNLNADKMNSHVRRALKKGLQTGVLIRPTRSSAQGATGRFKLADVKAAKKVEKKTKRNPTKTKSAKKPGIKKATAKANIPKSPRKKKSTGKKKAGKKTAGKPESKKASLKKKRKTTTKTKAKKMAKKPKVKKSSTAKRKK